MQCNNGKDGAADGSGWRMRQAREGKGAAERPQLFFFCSAASSTRPDESSGKYFSELKNTSRNGPNNNHPHEHSGLHNTSR